MISTVIGLSSNLISFQTTMNVRVAHVKMEVHVLTVPTVMHVPVRLDMWETIVKKVQC